MPAINSKQLSAMIKKGAKLIDVRSPVDYRNKTIENAINIPINTISTILTKFKNTDTLIFFGKEGSEDVVKSERYAEQLGYTKIFTFTDLENWFTN